MPTASMSIQTQSRHCRWPFSTSKTMLTTFSIKTIPTTGWTLLTRKLILMISCSLYYALNPVIRPQVKGFLDYAHERGAILYYDVNFRASHQHEVMKLTPNLLENFELADIVRGSSEDFDILFKKSDPDVIYRSQIMFYTKKFVYTQADKPVELRAEAGLKKQYPIESFNPVSTIGAGDNFNAGFIFGLLHHNITQKEMANGLTGEQWDRVIESALQFSAESCRSLYNYVSPEFGRQMKDKQ